MIKIYSNQNIALIGLARSFLEDNGISVVVRNEHSPTMMAETGFFDAWPEIWVETQHAKEARKLIDTFQEPTTTVNKLDFISCHSCLETNPSNFEICWKCGENLLLG